jgi:hypothetical protein
MITFVFRFVSLAGGRREWVAHGARTLVVAGTPAGLSLLAVSGGSTGGAGFVLLAGAWCAPCRLDESVSLVGLRRFVFVVRGRCRGSGREFECVKMEVSRCSCCRANNLLAHSQRKGARDRQLSRSLLSPL